MKKLVSSVLVFFTLLAPHAHAAVIAPVISININKITIGGDGNFDFHVWVHYEFLINRQNGRYPIN